MEYNNIQAIYNKVQKCYIFEIRILISFLFQFDFFRFEFCPLWDFVCKVNSQVKKEYTISIIYLQKNA